MGHIHLFLSRDLYLRTFISSWSTFALVNLEAVMSSNINSTSAPVEKDDLVRLETVMSHEENLKGDHMNYERVDKELAKYTAGERVYVSEADDKRLKKMIDRRVLVVMILTYFLQAIDKGTMSFTSIMGIREELHISGEQVSPAP